MDEDALAMAKTAFEDIDLTMLAEELDFRVSKEKYLPSLAMVATLSSGNCGKGYAKRYLSPFAVEMVWRIRRVRLSGKDRS